MTPSRADLTALLEPIAGDLDRMRGILQEQIDERSAAVRDMTGHVGRFRGKEMRASLLLLTGEEHPHRPLRLAGKP